MLCRTYHPKLFELNHLSVEGCYPLEAVTKIVDRCKSQTALGAKFELLANAADMGIDRAGLHLGTAAPYAFRNMPAGQQSTQISKQK